MPLPFSVQPSTAATIDREQITQNSALVQVPMDAPSAFEISNGFGSVVSLSVVNRADIRFLNARSARSTIVENEVTLVRLAPVARGLPVCQPLPVKARVLGGPCYFEPGGRERELETLWFLVRADDPGLCQLEFTSDALRETVDIVVRERS